MIDRKQERTARFNRKKKLKKFKPQKKYTAYKRVPPRTLHLFRIKKLRRIDG
jgi:hypothetical protein